MTFIPDQGTWLTNAEGQPLASVLSANPDPDHPGCVCVHVLPHREDGDLLLRCGTGAWRVEDRQTDMCFCIQALSCASTGLGYQVMVSSLGEPTAEPTDEDDDYLVVEDHDPISLSEVLIADGRCASGLHLRCEFKAEHFGTLPFRVTASEQCRCAHGNPYACASDETEGQSGEAIHRWRFCNLMSTGSCAAGSPNRASIVRLRQRVILDCEFHIAMIETPGEPSTAVCIGHVLSQQRWHKRDA
ncbi:MAG: hypothetical protein AAGI68_00705 [Planctomycetota bacterium]